MLPTLVRSRLHVARAAARNAASACAILCTATSPALAQTPTTRYFAEGVSNGFFSTRIAVLNPNATSVNVQFKFLREEGGVITHSVTILPHARFTLDPASVSGVAGQSYSTVLEADNLIVADRTVSWGAGGYGSHAETAIVAPARTWYLAEGSTSWLFTLFYLLQNPNPDPVTATIRYLLPSGAPITIPYQLAPNSRTTIQVHQQPGLGSTDVSAFVDATAPIIVERAMYLNRPDQALAAGHDSAGITTPATQWFLAEGATGSFFDLFVLIANPSDRDASIEVKYLLPSGQTLTKNYTVARNSRFTVFVDEEEFPGSTHPLVDTPVSTTVRSLNDVPIVVERTMWWPSPTWYEAHNSAGSTTTGTRWALADGEDGGASAMQTYVLIANTSSFAGQANVTVYFEDGTSESHAYNVPASSRTNVPISTDFCNVPNRRFAIVVDSLGTTPAQLVVERAMYSNAGTAVWAAGTNVVATQLPPASGTMSSATALAPVAAGACLPGPGPGPGNPPGTYPGYTYNLPTVRPFINVDDYTHINRQSQTFTRFKNAVDAAVAGHPPYAYSAQHSVIMFRMTGESKYIQDAIARVEQFVIEAEAAIAGGGRPALSGDSYLDVGWYIEQLALAYDHGYSRLTDTQRQRWARLADQAIYNVWNPDRAEWGGRPFHWSGWSISDPGNNYHYSFLRATMLWALATQNRTWFDFLQRQKYPPLVTYFAALPGGGSREGTGYGTAFNGLFQNYIYWKASTGEDLANLTLHTRETIDYWVHATVPTRDRFAPIGDQARVSIPDLYDYQENLVHQAVVLSPNTDQARRGVWWLQNNSVNGVASQFNLHGDLLPYPATALAPSALAYHSIGTGAFFARSGWDTGATWLSVVAGKYDQSHAHHDQGSFTFFNSDWLAVTSNIWSHSGIHQEEEVHNVLRFVRTNGSTIAQNASSTVASSLSYSTSGSTVNVAANLTNAFSSNRSLVQSWTRNLEFSGNVLRVHDVCSVGAGVKAIFQLQVPTQPVSQTDGSITAGSLRIVPLLPVTATFTAMPSPEFSKGYRIELTASSGCEFNVELRAQ